MPRKKKKVQGGALSARLNPKVLENFAKKNIIVVESKSSADKKYSLGVERQQKEFKSDCDFLENFGPVRTYIQRKYEIDIAYLELILKLYPMNYFNFEDYKSFPKKFQFWGIKNVLRKGIIEIVSEGTGYKTHVYCLSSANRIIVKKFYQMLAGDAHIPKTWPVMIPKSKLGKYERAKLELLDRLRDA